MPPAPRRDTGRRRRPAVPAVLLVVVSLLVTACSDGGSAAQEQGYVSGDGVIEQIPADERAEPPRSPAGCSTEAATTVVSTAAR